MAILQRITKTITTNIVKTLIAQDQTASGDWVLLTGFWNDSGVWDDNSNWID